MKAKTIFLTDMLLLLALVPAFGSGFVLHWAGHQDSHELWHNWAMVHVFSTLLFTIAVAFHLYGHWGWYKSLFRNGLKNKSRVTVLLTGLMFVEVISGNIVLIRHEGANSDLGLWHYGLGILLTVIVFGHFLKRHNLLFKGLKNSLK